MKQYRVLKDYQQFRKGQKIQLDENDYFTMYYIKKGIIEQYIKQKPKQLKRNNKL